MISKRISVIMPVYNGARYLLPAIESILAQSYGDFEFIIVDDASKDETPTILAQQHDPRIKVLTNDPNLGVVRSINRAIAIASGEYIARMDADDISQPERFAKQIAYFETHPEVGLIGTGAHIITPEGQYQQTMPPILTTDGGLRWYNLFGCPLLHPSVMMRHAMLLQVGGYDDSYVEAEDRDLWDRLFTVTKVAYLPEFLLLRRVHQSNISRVHGREQARYASGVAQRAMSAVLDEPVDFDLAAVMQNEAYESPDQVAAVADLMTQLYKAFTAKQTLTESEALWVRNDYAHRLFRMARHWPLEARMRRILLRAVATRPVLILHWVQKQIRLRTNPSDPYGLGQHQNSV